MLFGLTTEYHAVIMGSMRIARALALAGIAARRKCEAFILEGLVTVNGETVLDLGRQVDLGGERGRVFYQIMYHQAITLCLGILKIGKRIDAA